MGFLTSYRLSAYVTSKSHKGNFFTGLRFEVEQASGGLSAIAELLVLGYSLFRRVRVRQRYLMQFGYLAISDMETEQVRTLDEVRDAVRRLQRQAGLPQTGTFDRDTVQLMSTPRCGVQDVSAPALSRSAGPDSFTLNSGQWPNTAITYRYYEIRPFVSTFAKLMFKTSSEITTVTLHLESEISVRLPQGINGTGVLLIHPNFHSDRCMGLDSENYSPWSIV